MKSAALELGSHNITVNAVIPGLVDTALTRHEGRHAQAISEGGGEPTGDRHQDEQSAIASLKAKTPLGIRGSSPKTWLRCRLSSDEARMVSGTSFAATGGDSAHVAA